MTAGTPLKQRAKKLLPPGTRLRTLPTGIGRGLRMGLDLRDGHIGMYVGLYEVELNRHLKRLCYRGARCFDVGGSIGYDALVMAKLSRSNVVTVEASPELCERMSANVEANPRFAESVSVVHGYIDGGSARAEHLTIDDLTARHFMPDFIKIDIEGGETEALEGAKKTLSDRKPGLLIEVHSVELEERCLGLLRDLGYQPVVVDQRRLLPDHRPAEHNRWIVADGAPA